MCRLQVTDIFTVMSESSSVKLYGKVLAKYVPKFTADWTANWISFENSRLDFNKTCSPGLPSYMHGYCEEYIYTKLFFDMNYIDQTFRLREE